jgi:hypothetical protein
LRTTIPKRCVHAAAGLPGASGGRVFEGDGENIPARQPVDIFRPGLTSADPLLTLCDLFSVTPP